MPQFAGKVASFFGAKQNHQEQVKPLHNPHSGCGVVRAEDSTATLCQCVKVDNYLHRIAWLKMNTAISQQNTYLTADEFFWAIVLLLPARL